MTCSQRYKRWHEPRDRNMSGYLEITRLPGIIVTCTFSARRNCNLLPRTLCCLDYENFKVIIQIFTGCKWGELICTLPTLIGKQIERSYIVNCHLAGSIGKMEPLIIRGLTLDKIQTRVPGGPWLTPQTDLLPIICFPLPPPSVSKTCKNLSSKFFCTSTSLWMQIFTDLSAHFHVWSYLFRFVCLVS